METYSGRVFGEVRCVVSRPGLLFVGDYAAVLDDVGAIDELQLVREYPDGFSAARTHPYAVVPAPGVRALPTTQYAGATAAGAEQPAFWHAAAEVDAGSVATVRFDRPIPNRQGSFGLRHGVAYLLAGWHPVFAGASVAYGAAEPRPLALDVPLDYAITLPPNTVAAVGARPVGLGSRRTVRGRHVGSALPVVVAPAAHVEASEAGVVFAPLDRRGRASGHDDVTEVRDARALSELITALAIGHAGLAQARAAAGDVGPAPTPPLVVLAPLRHRLAEAFEGGVAVSDRAFHLPPWPLKATTRQLQRASLWRETLAVDVRHLGGARWRDGALPPWVSADAVGAAVRARLLLASGALAYVPELLDMPVVSPELDNLSFAPQVAFGDTWAEPVHESVAVGRRFDVAAAGMPRGKLLLEKARDRHGEAAVRAFAAALAPKSPSEPPADLLAALRAQGRSAWVDELLPWLGGVPARDYGLDAATPTGPRTRGAPADGAWVELTERRVAPNAATAKPVAEGPPAPVDVLVVEGCDAHGQRQRAARLGPGPLLVPGAPPFRWLQLDPGRRLGEASPSPVLQAGLNNRTPGRYRVLLNDVGVLLSATDLALAASVDFGLRRLYDLRYDFDFSAAVGPGSASFQLAAARHFGRAVTPLRLSDSVSASLSTARLRGEKEVGEMGQQLALSAGYLRDTRPSRYFALRGYGLRLQASVAGRVTAGQLVGPYGSVGAAALGLVPLGGRQALLGRLRADVAWGPVPPQTMLRLGGRYAGARGFEMGEARGTRRVLASAEWRHVLAGDARTDVGGLFTLTRLEGAVFADAAWLPVRVPRDCGRQTFADVGYGIRVLADIFGISPSMLAIDVGLPLGRCHVGGRERPITVYVDFAQSFVTF